MSVASALVKGGHASPELAADAVRIALDKAGIEHPHAVLLYLSADYAHDPQPALTAAARTANCLQIAGCTSAGLFTEEEWVLDTPAAAALVLGGDYRLEAPREDTPTLTLCAPNALDWNWLSQGGVRYGGVSGDATGQGPYTVWNAARVQSSGHCELALTGGRHRIGVSQGAQPLSALTTVTQADGHDLLSLEGEPALYSLIRELPPDTRMPERIPTHLLMLGVIYGNPVRAVEDGRYHLLPVLSANGDDKSVTVAAQVPSGTRVFWALRHPQAAENDMRMLVERLTADSLEEPRFALLFACTGRGPYFYGGTDKDIQQLTRHLPDMPLIGFYGNGEIAQLDGTNRLLQYSSVLGLYYDSA